MAIKTVCRRYEYLPEYEIDINQTPSPNTRENLVNLFNYGSFGVSDNELLLYSLVCMQSFGIIHFPE
jgi:hypothetical protein